MKRLKKEVKREEKIHLRKSITRNERNGRWKDKGDMDLEWKKASSSS